MATIEAKCPNGHECEAIGRINRQLEEMAASPSAHEFAQFNPDIPGDPIDDEATLIVGEFTTGFHAAVATTEHIQASLDNSGPCGGTERCNLAFLAISEYSGKGLLLNRPKQLGVSTTKTYTPVNINSLINSPRKEP